MSRRLRVKSTAPLVLLAFLGLRCTEGAAGVQVYVAYADTQNVDCPNPNPPAFMPNPWSGSPNTKFLGSGGPTWNTGAILIFNPGPSTVTLQGAGVTIGASPPFQLWAHDIGPGVAIGPGAQVILAQTSSAPSNFNTSGASGIAQIQLTIDGVQSTYADSGQILTTGGVALGSQTPAMNESLQWRVVGASGVNQPGGTGINPPPVLTWHNDVARTGQNPSETSLRPANVNPASFGQIGVYTGLDAPIAVQPLFVPNLLINGASHNAVIVETVTGSIYAFDAEMSYANPPALAWHPGATSSNQFALGTPVIDPGSNTLYFVTATPSTSSSTRAAFFLHALNLNTFTELSSSPVTINGSVPGTGEEQCQHQLPHHPKHVCFNAGNQTQRAALLLNNGTVYVAFADGGDHPPYHGWVFGYATQNLGNPPFVFNTTPNATTQTVPSCNAGLQLAGGGIWMFGAGPAADGNGIFLTTGNGDFNASASEYGDSILRLAPANQFPLADYFAPYDQPYLNCSDNDFGSTGPVLLQDKAKGYLVQATKTGRVYLINEANLGQNNPNCTTSAAQCDNVAEALDLAIGSPAGASVAFGSPAYFNNTVYYKANGDTLKGFKVVAVPPSCGPLLETTPIRASVPATQNSAIPSVSYDAATANSGIVWLVDTEGQTSQLEAYDPTTLGQLLSIATGVVPSNFVTTPPLIVDGKVFVAGGDPAGNNGRLAVFGNTAFPTPVPQGTLTVTKTLVPAGDSGRFDLLVDNVARATGVGNGGSTTLTVQAGTHTVSERADPGTSMSQYATVLAGACNSAGKVCVGPNSTLTCSIRNTHKLCPPGTTFCPNKYGLYACRATDNCSIVNGNPNQCPSGMVYCEVQVGVERVWACSRPSLCTVP